MKNIRFILRMFTRNPLLIFVNLPGLAIGLSAVLLLSVYLKHELSYDSHFKTKDNTLRLYNSVVENGQTTHYGICLRRSYTEVPQNIPEIESATQIYRGWKNTAEYDTKKYPSLDLLYADKGFFEVFGLQLIHGNRNDALAGDKKVVLNVSTAKRIFNRTDCIGEVISISEEPFIVSGVIKDLPNNTHFNFDLLASMQTINPEQFGGLEFFTYFNINDKANPEEVQSKIALSNNAIMKPWGDQFGLDVRSDTEKLSRIHFHSPVDFDLSPKANLTHIYVVAGIALLIFLIALVNFINIYVLHGEKRIAEIATRKSMGANQSSLSKLFFSETSIIGVLALLLALVITMAAQPYFAQLMQRQMEFGEIFTISGVVLVVFILSVIILISGAYPSLYLAKLDLVNALKGKTNQIRRKSTLSKISVVSQFTITVFLICSLVIVYAQINFLKDMPLGFNAQNVVGISNLNSDIKKSYQSIQDELQQLSFISDVGTSTHSMGQGSSGQGIKMYGSEENLKSINEYRINPGFCKTMQLEIQEGRYFNNSESDKDAVILNEAAVKLLGIDNPVGQLVTMHKEPMKVIAVVNDFYYNDHPGEAVAPLMLTNYSSRVNTFYIRTDNKISATELEQVEKLYKSYSPGFIFGHFRLTDVYANKFQNEERVMKLVSTGALLAIIISFIGLMALSVINVNRRKKEIGIRKVMGSSESQIIGTLLKETLILVLMSIGIAFVFNFITMQQWLTNFANRISINPVYFAVSALFAIIIAILAVGGQSWRAATQNPVNAIRDE